MRKKNFQPMALPTIPACEYVYHVVRRVSPLGNVFWIVLTVRYNSYELRLRYFGDDGLYFASSVVANDVKAVKQKYEKDVQLHAPQGA